jgi:hypothetical protein
MDIVHDKVWVIKNLKWHEFVEKYPSVDSEQWKGLIDCSAVLKNVDITYRKQRTNITQRTWL